MSDSSIPSDLVDKDTVKLRLAEERLQAFREQTEWYRLNAGTLLCDCSNCINARELKASNVGVSDGGGTRRPPVALPNASIFSRN